MKKRLVIIMLTALLLVSLAVSSYAEFFEPEFVLVNTFNTNQGSFVTIPEENNTALLKIVVDGNFESLNEVDTIRLVLNTSVNGSIEQKSATFYEPTTQLVYYVYGDYSAQTVYQFDYLIIGTNAETITNVNIYAAPITNDGTYDEGYDNGYNDGYDNGYDEAMNTADALGGAFEGFFNGMANFMDIFMDVGIGALTIRNMVGLCVIAVLVMVVIKVVRG